MKWSENRERHEASDTSFPYHEWEKIIRPPEQLKEGMENWCPVYVSINPDVQSNAKDLLERIEANQNLGDDVRANEEAQHALLFLARGDFDSAGADHRRYFFLYRPESQAAVALEHTDSTPEDPCYLYTVRQIGPSIPQAFLKSVPEEPASLLGGSRAGNDIVLTGIIDDAIGIANARFMSPENKTRIRRYWRQITEGFPDVAITGAATGVRTGLQLTGARLDQLFDDLGHDEEAIYRWIEEQSRTLTSPGAEQLDAIRLTMRQGVSHGTFVADLAAGGEFTCEKRPIAAIELPPLATAETWGARLEVYVLMAIQKMLHWADNWIDSEDQEVRQLPLVINLSYSLTAGPKNGMGFLEREIARHVDGRNQGTGGVPTAIMLAAGNSYRARSQAYVNLPSDETRESIYWHVPVADQAPAFLELHFAPMARAILIIAPPGGPKRAMNISRDAVGSLTLYTTDEPRVAIARVTLDKMPSDDNADEASLRLVIAVAPTQNWSVPEQTAPAGAWRISLEAAGKVDEEVFVCVHRDESPSGFPRRSRPSWLSDGMEYGFDEETRRFDNPHPDGLLTRDNSITALGNGPSRNVLVVGASVNLEEEELREPSARAAARYTASGKDPRHTSKRPADKPNVAACAEDGFATTGRLGAGTFSGSVVALGGTSTAAPIVTRALVEAWAGQDSPVKDDPMKSISSSDDYIAFDWDPRLGEGITRDPASMSRDRRMTSKDTE